MEGVQVVREDDLFDGRFRLIGELEALAAEDLDAVVLEGVVGGGDDDARIGPHAVGEKGDPRRGDHADHDGVDAHGADPGDEGILQHVSGEAGVLADDDLGNMSLFLEEMRRGAADVHGHFRRHGVFVRHPPNPVCTE